MPNSSSRARRHDDGEAPRRWAVRYGLFIATVAVAALVFSTVFLVLHVQHDSACDNWRAALNEALVVPTAGGSTEGLVKLHDGGDAKVISQSSRTYLQLLAKKHSNPGSWASYAEKTETDILTAHGCNV